jgi:thiol-disulfide isomerase/thioredoxin
MMCKMTCKTKAWMLVAGLAGLLAGCSGNSHNDRDSGPPPPDRSLVDLLGTPSDGSATCGLKVYPCAPYGTKTKDVTTNVEFLGFTDPGQLCKDHKDEALDLNTVAKVTFKDWYRADPTATCGRQLLWVIVSAGWCGPCKAEVKSTQEQYAAGAVDKRLGILNVVFETDDQGVPADETFIKQWISAFKVTFPVVMDPTFKMGLYFDKAATPFNMLVDTSSMRIYYTQVGGDASTVGPQIQAFFSGK